MFALTKPFIKLYCKIRHRRGHGIHSPFVYALIVNVLENKLPFYAFRDIEKYIETKTSQKYKTQKYNKLVYKLIHDFQAKKILEIGIGKGINTLYASAPSRLIECLCIDTNSTNRSAASALLDRCQRNISMSDSLPETNQKFDCVIVDFLFCQMDTETFSAYLFAHIHENSLIILNNIRTKESVYSLVQKIRKNEQIRLSFDLYNVGIFLLNKKYQKRNYLLNF